MIVRIVTDSGVHFNSPHYAEQQGVSVVPYHLDIDGRLYRDGMDMPAEDLFRMIARANEPVRVMAPTRDAYAAVYEGLVREADGIISIHTSKHLSASYDHAVEASRLFAGHCPIVVIDSGQICFAQGLLVKAALRACQQQTTFDSAVQIVRGVVERLYSIYYVETVNYLARNKLLSLSHSVMTTLIGLKLVLSMEEGHLRPIEKVRTRAQAVERLVEFAGEFADIEEGVIVQPKTVLAESARMVQDRLLNDFPAQAFPYALYSPVLASLIGTDATGIVILEKELRGIEDDFFKKIRIVTDSTADLPPDLVAKWKITVVPAYVNYGGGSFADDGVDLNRDDYYSKMASLKPYPSTAAPAPGLSEKMLKEALADADHLVVITAPAALSGIHNSLRLGAMDIQDRVTLIDSEMLSWGLGYQAEIGAEVAAESGDVDKVVQAMERVRKHVRVYFTPETMDALRRSGRVSMAMFGVAQLLQVRPVIEVGHSKVESIAKVRTASKAVERVIELTRQNAPYDRVAIGHVNSPEAAELVRKALADVLPANTRLFTVTPVLGTNLGNNAVGVISLNQGWKA